MISIAIEEDLGLLNWYRFLGTVKEPRKTRLFALACCQRTAHLITDARAFEALRLVDLYTDGRVTEEEVGVINCPDDISIDARNAEMNGAFGLGPDATSLVANSTAMTLCYWDIPPAALYIACRTRWVLDPTKGTGYRKEALTQYETLEDIFAANDRTDPINPRWLSSTVIDLAQTFYDSKQFEGMPILADALMDAGCDDEDIIKHCHSGRQHIRGCWVIDLLLRKWQHRPGLQDDSLFQYYWKEFHAGQTSSQQECVTDAQAETR